MDNQLERRSAVAERTPEKLIARYSPPNGVAQGELYIQTLHSRAIPLSVERSIEFDSTHPKGSPTEDHDGVVAHKSDLSQSGDLPDVVVIRELWRQYSSWLRAKVRLELAAQAQCRRFTEGDKKAAAALWAKAKKSDDIDPALAAVLAPFIDAISRFEKGTNETFGYGIKQITKELEKLAKATPYWPLIPRGFGPLGLAGLIGEAGDPWGYHNPSALWKRMGLAVIDGKRQRKVADAEEAIRQGYTPRRRAWAYMTGDNMIRAKSPVCEVYRERKEKKIVEGWSKLHAHRDAKMFMVKRVLRDLWAAGPRAHEMFLSQKLRSPGTGN